MRLRRFVTAATALGCAALLVSQGVLAHADSLTWRWDGPVNNLSWDGQVYYTAADSFLGNPVVVPGDHIRRTAVFMNTGPSNGTATVQLVNATATDYLGTVNVDLRDLVSLYMVVGGRLYEATWSQAIADGVGHVNAFSETVSWQVSFPVLQSQEFDVTVGAKFPASATSGRSAGELSQSLSAAVRVILQGDTSGGPTPPGPTPPVPTPSLPSSPGPNPSTPAEPGPGDPGRPGGSNAPTGGHIANEDWVWGTGALLVGGFALLVPTLRRRQSRNAMT